MTHTAVLGAGALGLTVAYRPVVREGRELDILDPLRAIIRDHHELAATPAGWPIYLLRTAGSTGDE